MAAFALSAEFELSEVLLLPCMTLWTRLGLWSISHDWPVKNCAGWKFANMSWQSSMEESREQAGEYGYLARMAIFRVAICANKNDRFAVRKGSTHWKLKLSAHSRFWPCSFATVMSKEPHWFTLFQLHQMRGSYQSSKHSRWCASEGLLATTRFVLSLSKNYCLVSRDHFPFSNAQWKPFRFKVSYRWILFVCHLRSLLLLYPFRMLLVAKQC